MSRRPASFTETDIRRACKAAPDRTVEVVVRDGTIVRLIPSAAEAKEDVGRVATGREIVL
jgi:hypothetical protein